MAALGELIHRYRIDAKIGEGGMGQVFRAFDTQLERVVAIKLLRGEDSIPPAERPARVARMRDEARAVAKLSHPNVVAIYDVGEHEEAPYLVMEFISGRSLRSIIGRESIPLDKRIGWMIDVARALEAAHGVGLVHRDVKPENVMLRDDGVIKVLDFGIARRAPLSVGSTTTNASLLDDPSRPTATGAGMLVGTPGYMAPEQLRGQPVDGRTDQFAWAVMAYELFTGKSPWGTHREAVSLISAILADAPQPPSALVTGLAPEVESVVLRALSKTAEARHSSMGVVVRALGGSGQPVPASSGAPADRPSGSLPDARTPSGGFPETTAPLPVTGHPLPQSSSAEALEAYAAALQAFRDGDWQLAKSELKRAIEHDPRLGAAHLRLCIASRSSRTPRETQAAYKVVLKLRDGLAPRDKSLVRALEPLMLFDPSDLPETQRRVVALADRHANDAELQLVAAWISSLMGDHVTGEKYDRRAVAIDPDYADSWQGVAHHSAARGDLAAALEALDRGLEASPAGADLYFERAKLHALNGDHVRVEADARRALSLGVGAAMSHLRASALFALGRPLDAVREVLVRGHAELSPERRSYELVRIEACIPILAGDFARARALLEAALKDAPDPAKSPIHAMVTGMLVRLALETGDAERATELAAAGLDQRDVWARPPSVHDDPGPMLAAVALRAGRCTPHAAKSVVDSFIQEWTSAPAAIVHVLARAPFALVGGAIEPLSIDLPRRGGFVFTAEALNTSALTGAVLHAMGREAEAAEYLRLAVKTTAATVDPFVHTYASYDLGRALEAIGDAAGALDAYRAILARWGDAKPCSTTADAARARIAALELKR